MAMVNKVVLKFPFKKFLKLYNFCEVQRDLYKSSGNEKLITNVESKKSIARKKAVINKASIIEGEQLPHIQKIFLSTLLCPFLTNATPEQTPSDDRWKLKKRFQDQILRRDSF